MEVDFKKVEKQVCQAVQDFWDETINNGMSESFGHLKLLPEAEMEYALLIVPVVLARHILNEYFDQEIENKK